MFISGTSPSIIRSALVAEIISSTLTNGALSSNLNPFSVTSKTAKLVTTFLTQFTPVIGSVHSF